MPIHRFLIPETGIFRAIPHNSLKRKSMRKLCGISSTQFDDCLRLLSFAVNTAADALDALVFPQMLQHSRTEHTGSLAVDDP